MPQSDPFLSAATTVDIDCTLCSSGEIHKTRHKFHPFSMPNFTLPFLKKKLGCSPKNRDAQENFPEAKKNPFEFVFFPPFVLLQHKRLLVALFPPSLNSFTIVMMNTSHFCHSTNPPPSPQFHFCFRTSPSHLFFIFSKNRVPPIPKEGCATREDTSSTWPVSLPPLKVRLL